MSAVINTFNNHNKTKAGLIFSFIFIALSILYALFTLIDYFKYSTPSVIYFKENERKNFKTFDMKDPFIFALYNDGTPVNDSDINVRAFYMKNSLSETDSEFYPINIEKCEYGKNVDEKFKDQLYLRDENYCLSDEETLICIKPPD